MGVTLVRPGDVFVLPIPGDNRETKDRFCIVLGCYPTFTAAEVVSIIFGCSLTKRTALPGDFVRVGTEPAAQFRGLGLLNATTFHLEDIRYYDARSPRLDRGRRRGYCPPGLMLALRGLADRRDLMPVAIPLLPEQARDEAANVTSAREASRLPAPPAQDVDTSTTATDPAKSGG